ncbi:hypothetical protein IW261DRAFT_1592148 [Armillaria novae-zelandiae]|uniref:Uncharacterized protein n=1 Tax=Armillaria novae-zelandiae TaxID=153914 RepID=A0AA39TDV5_9AGAR|nr:hypothetical protein IW261DRAFT_1592148 [Armillaria novae-zelandiae]
MIFQGSRENCTVSAESNFMLVMMSIGPFCPRVPKPTLDAVLQIRCNDVGQISLQGLQKRPPLSLGYVLELPAAMAGHLYTPCITHYSGYITCAEDLQLLSQLPMLKMCHIPGVAPAFESVDIQVVITELPSLILMPMKDLLITVEDQYLVSLVKAILMTVRMRTKNPTVKIGPTGSMQTWKCQGGQVFKASDPVIREYDRGLNQRDLQ